MDSVRKGVACAVLAGVVVAGHGDRGEIAAAQAPDRPAVRRGVPRFQAVPAAGAVFEFRRGAAGTIQIEGRTGELTVTKTVSGDGTFTLDLSAAQDEVSVAFAGHSVTVTRGGRQAVLNAGDEASMTRVATLLAGSRAVTLMRAAASGIVDAEDKSVAGAALLVADGLVGTLTGDVGALGRTARYLARARRATVQRVEVSEESCYKSWERNVTEAWDDFAMCAEQMGYWNPAKYLCAFAWALEVETEWFHMLACVGFDF
jgi:hypothetical protein